MGNKRKHDNSEEEIKKKIRKLEAKLVQKRRRRIISNTSSEYESDNVTSDAPLQCHVTPRGESRCSERAHLQRVLSQPTQRSTSCSPPPAQTLPEPPASLMEPIERPASPLLPPHPPAPSAVRKEPIPSHTMPSTSSDLPIQTEDLELDSEILLILGDAPKIDAPLAPPLHKDVASRWQETLSKGLSKEAKEKLRQEYLIPSNCPLIEAPILNPEAKAAIPETLVKRDSSLFYKQKQLGLALCALASATKLILENETSKQKVLKPLSDACRILCDSHYTETKTRRNFVVFAINSSLKDTLVESPRDKFLFGENVSEKLKTAKNIQKTGDVLKNVTKNPFHKSNFIQKNKTSNFKPQYRKTENKPAYQSREPLPAAPSRGARAPTRPATTRSSSHRATRSPMRRPHRK